MEKLGDSKENHELNEDSARISLEFGSVCFLGLEENNDGGVNADKGHAGGGGGGWIEPEQLGGGVHLKKLLSGKDDLSANDFPS